MKSDIKIKIDAHNTLAINIFFMYLKNSSQEEFLDYYTRTVGRSAIVGMINKTTRISMDPNIIWVRRY